MEVKILKQKIKYVIFTVLLGLFIGFLYNHIVIPDSYRKEIFLYKDSIKLCNLKCISKTYAILYKETLRLKITSSSIQKTITFNNKILAPYKTKTYHRKLENLFAKVYSKPVDHVFIPADMVNIGKNRLKLSFPPDIRDCVTIKIGNYHRNTNNQIFVLFKDSHIFLLKRNPIAYLYSVLIVLFIFLSLLWRAGEHIYSKFLISLLPANILLLLAYIIVLIIELKLFITSGYFWTVQAVLSAFTCSVFFYSYNNKIINKIVMHHLVWIKAFWQWLKPRPFSDKCIVLFMFLLIACALLLIAHLEKAAEHVANVAYFALCLGAVIKFVQLVRDNKKK